MEATWVALGVFLLTYFLISIRRLPGIRIKRPSAALLGAGLMILFGVVSPERAFQSIDVEILLLLLGMMLIVVGLELCGLFEWISLTMIRHSGSQFQLLLLTMASTAVLSALVLNDAVVLLFTPVIIKTCRLLKTNPIPFLIGEVMAANIGSVATMVGNPQNAYIATRASISFVDFSMALAPISACCLVVAVLMVYLFFRKGVEKGRTCEFRALKTEKGWEALRQEILGKDEETRNGLLRMETRRRGLQLGLGITLLAVVGFFLSHMIGVPVSVIAFLAGASALFILPIITDLKAGDMLKGVDWSIILFFIGLFVVLQGVRDSGLLLEMQSLFPGFGEGLRPGVGWLTTFSAVLSNLVSNVPAVMLIGEMIPPHDIELWIALASSSTLAGNATILGAAANIIVAERAENMGVEIGFFRFAMIGVPLAVVTLLISMAILVL